MKTVAFAGEVDFGKSTLVGKFLQETNALSLSRIEAISKLCENTGRRFEPAFLLDCLEEERVQEKTWDYSEFLTKYGGQSFRIIDTPGHREFAHKMASGASHCDIAVLVCDATAKLEPHHLRHLTILRSLGVGSIIVAVNKMDLVGFSAQAFLESVERVQECALRLGLMVERAIPVSGITGDGIVRRISPELSWYAGPTLIETFSRATPRAQSQLDEIILMVQAIGEDQTIYARVENGFLKSDTPLFLHEPGGPSLQVSWKTITWPLNVDASHGPGTAIALNIEGLEEIRRGSVLTNSFSPPDMTQEITAWIAPFSENSISSGASVGVRLGFQTMLATVTSWDGHAIGLRLRRPVFRWAKAPLPLRRISMTLGVGVIEPYREEVSHPQIIWLTGLSASGKTTLARAFEERLRELGVRVRVLDGDELRAAIPVGFSKGDRHKNVERASKLAKALEESGAVVIVSMISPYKESRASARRNARVFREVHISTPLGVCETRDPKGLYKKARSGEVAEFTGVSAIYEIPQNPDLSLDTDRLSLPEAVAQLERLWSGHEYGARISPEFREPSVDLQFSRIDL